MGWWSRLFGARDDDRAESPSAGRPWCELPQSDTPAKPFPTVEVTAVELDGFTYVWKSLPRCGFLLLMGMPNEVLCTKCGAVLGPGMHVCNGTLHKKESGR